MFSYVCLIFLLIHQYHTYGMENPTMYWRYWFFFPNKVLTFSIYRAHMYCSHVNVFCLFVCKDNKNSILAIGGIAANWGFRPQRSCSVGHAPLLGKLFAGFVGIAQLRLCAREFKFSSFTVFGDILSFYWLLMPVQVIMDCLERLVPEMTYYVLRGMLNSTHLLTHSMPNL